MAFVSLVLFLAGVVSLFSGLIGAGLGFLVLAFVIGSLSE
jgi:hypothetical protein